MHDVDQLHRAAPDDAPTCSIFTASILLGRSERTLQRWCEEGALRTVHRDPRKSQRQLIDLRQVLERFGLLPDAAFPELVVQADRGDADAQTELALALLATEHNAAAVTFLEAAARQGRPEAMHWLFLCHIQGRGVPRDEDQAMAWLNKAAANGHVIAREQARALRVAALRQMQRQADEPR